MIRRVSAARGLLIVFALLGLAVNSTVYAQGGRSELNGTVLDPDKAVLPGVTITATNEANGLERTMVTGPEGKFLLPTLPPGTYTIKAELSGIPANHQNRCGGQRRPGIDAQPDAAARRRR